MTRSPAAAQLLIDFGHRPGFSRDELLVTSANAEAVGLIDRWPEWSSPVVVLAGPAGSGKSHLASIWAEQAGAARLSPTNIGEGASVALIDGADAGGLDETGLFHLINTVKATGGSLLLTARNFPSAWNVQLADLASRLRAATTVEVHEPDDALLIGVMTKLFADRQIEVEPHVISFLARRIERSLATAMRVVERLDALALDRQTRISRNLAAEVVTALDQGQSELPL